MGQLQVQKVNWWHERLADWMIANPQRNLKDAAKEFNVAVNTIYIVHNSDAFQIYWATRSGDFSEALKNRTADAQSSVMERACAVTAQALDELGERLAKVGAVMPVEQLLDISKMGLSSLGYKANKGSPAQVQVNIGAVDPSALARAREKMREAYGTEAAEPNTEVIDITPKLME